MIKRLAIIFGVVLLVGFAVVQNSSENADSTYVPSGDQVFTPETQLPTATAPTETETTPPTQPPTQPTTLPPATEPTFDTNTPEGIVAAFEYRRMSLWTNPLKVSFEEVTGSRKFASSRGGGARAHAGLDFVAPHGTSVYAITSGTVQRVAVFYENTWAVEVLNDDGSILRYCEIKTSLEVGDRLEQGQLVGTILRADSGTEMLHMEVYYGNGEGRLTQGSNRDFLFVDESKNYQRRSDLMDPTFLKDLAVFGT